MNSVIPRAGTALSLRSLAVSLGLHCLVLGSLFLVTLGTADNPPPPAIGSTRVRLVSLPPSPVVETAEATAVSEASSTPTMPAVEESKRVARASATAAVKSVARRSPMEHIALGKRKRSAKRVDVPKPDKTAREDGAELVEKRVSALRDEVEKRKRAAEKSSADGKADGVRGAGSPQADPELTAWLSQVKHRINANWTLFQDVREKSPATVIGIRIADDGALIGANVDKGSGDAIFDRSALRAVHQASPLPAPPPDVKRRIADSGGLALRFTPSGMQ